LAKRSGRHDYLNMLGRAHGAYVHAGQGVRAEQRYEDFKHLGGRPLARDGIAPAGAEFYSFAGLAETPLTVFPN